MPLKKVGNKFEVISKTTGKAVTPPMSHDEALKRERQIQFFVNDAQYQKDHHGQHIPIEKPKKRGK